MNTVSFPAPLWRRLAAATYDVLLLLGILLAATLFAVLLSQLAFKVEPPHKFMTAYLFLLTFGFFGWFWTHGGQTLGMRAWRLQLVHPDGQALSWSTAMLRFAVAIPSWLLGGLGMIWCLLDGQRRSWQDIVAGTEVHVLPKD